MRALLLAPLLFAAPAHADLYRSIDPASGSVKYSSEPPRGAPAEVLPYRGAQAAPAGAEQGVEALEERRRTLLQLLAARPGTPEAAAKLRGQVEAYRALTAELDRRDPAGAARRRAEEEALAESLKGAAATRP